MCKISMNWLGRGTEEEKSEEVVEWRSCWSDGLRQARSVMAHRRQMGRAVKVREKEKDGK